MQYHDFLGQEQNRAQLSSTADAEIATNGEMKGIRTQLTDDYAPLFEKGAQGHL